MPEDIFKILTPVIIALLIIWLIYRIKLQVRHMIRNEIYTNFPSIKDAIGSFERRIDYFKSQVDALERRMNEIERRTKY